MVLILFSSSFFVLQECFGQLRSNQDTFEKNPFLSETLRVFGSRLAM